MPSGKCATLALCVLVVAVPSHVSAEATRYRAEELFSSPIHEYLQVDSDFMVLALRQHATAPLQLPIALPHLPIEDGQNGRNWEIRPPSFTSRSRAHSFNDVGQITGYGESIDANGQLYQVDGAPTVQRRAFFYSNGVFTDLSDLLPSPRGAVATHGWGSEGIAINKRGEVAGIWTDAEGTHGFYYAQGTVVELGSLSSSAQIDTRPTAINESGYIVGSSDRPGGGARAFLYGDGAMQDLGVVGAHVFSAATDINDAGQIVGKLGGNHGNGCFLYEQGTMRELGTLGGPHCHTAKINNAGIVVGSTTRGGEHDDPVAYVYVDGQMHDLNRLTNWPPMLVAQQWHLTDVLSISDHGSLLATGISATGQLQYFVLRPESEVDTEDWHRRLRRYSAHR